MGVKGNTCIPRDLKLRQVKGSLLQTDTVVMLSPLYNKHIRSLGVADKEFA